MGSISFFWLKQKPLKYAWNIEDWRMFGLHTFLTPVQSGLLRPQFPRCKTLPWNCIGFGMLLSCHTETLVRCRIMSFCKPLNSKLVAKKHWKLRTVGGNAIQIWDIQVPLNRIDWRMSPRLHRFSMSFVPILVVTIPNVLAVTSYLLWLACIYFFFPWSCVFVCIIPRPSTNSAFDSGVSVKRETSWQINPKILNRFQLYFCSTWILTNIYKPNSQAKPRVILLPFAPLNTHNTETRHASAFASIGLGSVGWWKTGNIHGNIIFGDIWMCQRWPAIILFKYVQCVSLNYVGKKTVACKTTVALIDFPLYKPLLTLRASGAERKVRLGGSRGTAATCSDPFSRRCDPIYPKMQNFIIKSLLS